MTETVQAAADHPLDRARQSLTFEDVGPACLLRPLPTIAPEPRRRCREACWRRPCVTVLRRIAGFPRSDPETSRPDRRPPDGRRAFAQGATLSLRRSWAPGAATGRPPPAPRVLRTAEFTSGPRVPPSSISEAPDAARLAKKLSDVGSSQCRSSMTTTSGAVFAASKSRSSRSRASASALGCPRRSAVSSLSTASSPSMSARRGAIGQRRRGG